ncbi:hypothetical protein C1I98_24680 [Spongiactinospora gelatinilytica]|uniref:Uncharacterized protein n=2 Tax=Spongiactinospora gelatinilytica TaxID=2666298 RepID=A0A2W2FL98_9ACTN|nr:hypothetical protein C1I98_24680 [Spongiactinospora gelatinilytica]
MGETTRERAERVMDERRAELGLNWEEVIELTGLTKEGLRTIRRGEALNPRTRSRRGIESALQWTVGSFDRLLQGGDPIPLPPGANTWQEEFLRRVTALLSPRHYAHGLHADRFEAHGADGLGGDPAYLLVTIVGTCPCGSRIYAEARELEAVADLLEKLAALDFDASRERP